MQPRDEEVEEVEAQEDEGGNDDATQETEGKVRGTRG